MVAAPLSGSGVLARALLRTSGWKDFISTSGVGPLQGSPCPQGYEHWQCETQMPTYVQCPYSLKPPGASLATLPCHPSPTGSLGMVYRRALGHFTLAYLSASFRGQLSVALSRCQALGLLASGSHMVWVTVWFFSSPVFGSTSHCPITQFPCPSIPLPSGVRSFGSTPPSQDIILLSTVVIHHPSRSIPIIKSSGVQTPVLPSWTSVLLSWTYFPFDVAQSLTAGWLAGHAVPELGSPLIPGHAVQAPALPPRRHNSRLILLGKRALRR